MEGLTKSWHCKYMSQKKSSILRIHPLLILCDGVSLRNQPRSQNLSLKGREGPRNKLSEQLDVEFLIASPHNCYLLDTRFSPFRNIQRF